MSGSRPFANGGRSPTRWHDRPGGSGHPDRGPNIRQKGIRLGNRLTREQAKELLAVPDRSTLGGSLPGEIFKQIGHYQPWSLAVPKSSFLGLRC
jgi:hypothetical protein